MPVASDAKDVRFESDAVDQSRHYLDRRGSEPALLTLILGHFDELERWSSDLARHHG